MKLLITVLVAIAICVHTATCALRLPQFLTDNMVLQRNTQNPIWGWTQPNADVAVGYDGKAYSVRADLTGAWSIQLDVGEADGRARSLAITSDGNKILFQNIAVGDVYFCSGQSNMQMSISQVFNASTEIAQANFPDLRFVTIARNPSLTPQADAQILTKGWTVSSPLTVNGSDWNYVSAVCFLFGRDIHVATGLPIGLVESDYGGTRVEAWSSADVLEKCGSPHFGHSNPNPSHPKVDPNTATALWNGMVVPLLPLRFTGTLWYQGEANLGNPSNYTCLFPAMIADWRARMNNKNMYFYFVQVSTWVVDADVIPVLRAAQMSGLTQPLTGMVTAMDLSDWSSPYNCIHPRNKQEVAARLSLLALNEIYGQQNVPCLSATYQSHSVNSAAAGQFEATVVFNNVYQGLQWNSSIAQTSPVTGFEISTDGLSWTAAAAQIAGVDSVRVTASVSDPSAVKQLRYAWQNWPVCTIYNSANLPALQFLIDV